MADLPQDEWIKQLQDTDNAVVLDVRTEAEVEEGIIPNAVHLDFYQGQAFLEALENLDKTKAYFVYCRSGNRSGQACAIMDKLGFKTAHNLIGGMNTWVGDVVDK